MRIRGAELVVVQVPFAVPIESGGTAWERVRSAILTLHADGDHLGLGEAAPWPDVDATVGRELLARVEGLALDDDAALGPRLADIAAEPLGGQALRAALASAVVDLRAQVRQLSLAAFLGPTPKPAVRVNGLIGRTSPEQAATQARRLVEGGYDCIKVKGGAEPTELLVARCAAVSEAAGPGVALRVDLNGTLDETGAAEVLASLAPLGPEYVEQPLAAGAGIAALARLRGRSGVPIAADESVTDIGAACALLQAGAVDALVVKPSRVGGLREAMAIVEAAANDRVPVTISTLFESGVGIAGALHVAAATPGDHAHGLATAHLLASDLLEQPLRIERGRMALPPGPGLGVRLDLSAIERYRVG